MMPSRPRPFALCLLLLLLVAAVSVQHCSCEAAGGTAPKDKAATPAVRAVIHPDGTAGAGSNTGGSPTGAPLPAPRIPAPPLRAGVLAGANVNGTLNITSSSTYNFFDPASVGYVPPNNFGVPETGFGNSQLPPVGTGVASASDVPVSDTQPEFGYTIAGGAQFLTSLDVTTTGLVTLQLGDPTGTVGQALLTYILSSSAFQRFSGFTAGPSTFPAGLLSATLAPDGTFMLILTPGWAPSPGIAYNYTATFQLTGPPASIVLTPANTQLPGGAGAVARLVAQVLDASGVPVGAGVVGRVSVAAAAAAPVAADAATHESVEAGASAGTSTAAAVVVAPDAASSTAEVSPSSYGAAHNDGYDGDGGLSALLARMTTTTDASGRAYARVAPPGGGYGRHLVVVAVALPGGAGGNFAPVVSNLAHINALPSRDQGGDGYGEDEARHRGRHRHGGEEPYSS